MSTDRTCSHIPLLVQRAQSLADEMACTTSSLAEVGRLLAVLTAACPSHSRIAEIGTGCGVGTAWMASTLPTTATLISIDTNQVLVDAVRPLFRDEPRVHILQGDWRNLITHHPFHLLFADGGKAKVDAPDTLIDLLDIGGTVVLDDFTPEEYWPDSWKGQVDEVRRFWLSSARITATEIRVTERHAVIIATRVT